MCVWAGALGWWLAPLPFTPQFGVRFPVSAVWKKQKMFLPHPRVKVSIVGSLRDREVACSASDRQGSNFESCVWRTVSSQSSHHPQGVLLAQSSLYVHKGGLKPDLIHFYLNVCALCVNLNLFALPLCGFFFRFMPGTSEPLYYNPVNTKHLYNIYTTSVQHFPHWSSIV